MCNILANVPIGSGTGNRSEATHINFIMSKVNSSNIVGTEKDNVSNTDKSQITWNN
jgi:hypothetical protein